MKKHLNLEARSLIAAYLAERKSLCEIADKLNVSVSTVSREIKKHRVKVSKACYGYSLNNCAKAKECRLTAVCTEQPDCVTKQCRFCSKCNHLCSEFEYMSCPLLSKAPYVCNGCEKRWRCRLDKYDYVPDKAHKEYKTLLSEARSGFNMTEDELSYADSFISERISKGQSVYHIAHSDANILPCSESTIYRLIGSGIISARKIDLPRAVRFRPRKGSKVNMKIDKRCRIGRSYEDYIAFRAEHPDIPVAEMDSVIGHIGGKVLLTIIIERINFMLAFIRERNTAQSVIDVFNHLYTVLPNTSFSSLFGCLLTDNGTEFSNPSAVEFDPVSKMRRSFVFYCNPSSPYQKPKIENHHLLLRTIFPKGTSMDSFTQQDINLALSHINSYGRAVFNGVSPAELFVNMYGIELLHLLGQVIIPSENIILKPSLLKK